MCILFIMNHIKHAQNKVKNRMGHTNTKTMSLEYNDTTEQITNM